MVAAIASSIGVNPATSQAQSNQRPQQDGSVENQLLGGQTDSVELSHNGRDTGSKLSATAQVEGASANITDTAASEQGRQRLEGGEPATRNDNPALREDSEQNSGTLAAVGSQIEDANPLKGEDLVPEGVQAAEEDSNPLTQNPLQSTTERLPGAADDNTLDVIA